MTERLHVGIVGCGLIGRKRAAALGPDILVGCYDLLEDASRSLAEDFGARHCHSLDQLLGLVPDVVVVAVTHDELAENSCAALSSGAHVLVEKPAGIGTAQIDAIGQAAKEAKRLVKVGFNHRFYPGIAKAILEARSGIYGPILFSRARYGHGGRVGYETEWRADPIRSGGGEVVDQGMHLLDLNYWIFGGLPLHSSLLRTQFWDAQVDDNAVLVLGEKGGVGSPLPWALIHVSWTEWKNLFSLEIYCRDAKFAIDGLVGSYGPQRLQVFRMKPELGPPDVDEYHYSPDDESWMSEWNHFSGAVSTQDNRELLGDLSSARYAWHCVEQAQSL